MAVTVPAAVALPLIVNEVAFVMPVMKALPGMPVPLIIWPTAKPAVLATVIVAEAFVVVTLGVVTKFRRGIESVCVTPPAARMAPDETVRVLLPVLASVRGTVSVIARPRRVRLPVAVRPVVPAATLTTSLARAVSMSTGVA